MPPWRNPQGNLVDANEPGKDRLALGCDNDMACGTLTLMLHENNAFIQ